VTAHDERDLTHQGSITIARPADEVYALVSDVTRTGEWSPVCRACWWDPVEDPGDDPADGPRVGAWFSGRNEVPGRIWTTRSQVVAAEPGRSFAFVVGGSLVRWSFDLEEVDGGTRLTESWHFLPAGLELFDERYGDDAPTQVADRIRLAHEGIPATLAAIKRIAEG
jgi:hypothetical protein